MVNLEIHTFFVRARLAFATLLVTSVLSLSAAFYLQVFQNLPPCMLCQYQRLPYFAVTGIAFLGFLITGNNTHHRIACILLVFCVFAFLTGSAMALFHLGVENTWWGATSGCKGMGFRDTNLKDLKDAIINAPIANCSDVLWRYLGVSLAGWNLIWSLFLTLVTGLVAANWIYNKRR